MFIVLKNKLVIVAAVLNFILVCLVIFLSLELTIKNKFMLPVLESEQEVEQKILILELFKPIDFTVDFFGMKYQGNSANMIDSNVLYFGAYEKDILFLMRDIMLSIGTDDSVFVDIGANKGQHSLFMSKYANVIHAFEPYERVLKDFRSHIKLNNIENIIIHPVGLGDKEEKITFFEPPENNLGTGTFVESYLEDKTKGGQMQIVTGDAALNDIDADRIDLIKMDIEGYEKPALKGLRNTLEVSRPFVVIEISIDPEIDIFFKSMDELKAAFPIDYGFVTFVKRIKNRKSGRYEFVSFNGDFSQQGFYNLVAYPEEKVTHIQLKRGTS